MSMREHLHIYEALMLLALKDQEGTVAADGVGFPFSLGGSLLAELMLLGKVEIQEVKKKKFVNLKDSTPVGDPLLDECLEKVRTAKKRAQVNVWVSRFAHLKKLRHRAAEQLCRRGILRADEESVLLIFKRKVYPELDPGPERKVIEALRKAIFSDEEELNPLTSVLVALADKAGVLKNVFDKKELKARKARLKEIGEGEATAAAVKELVQATQVAVMSAVTASTVAATSAAT
jgi:hypothetical protein